MVSANWDGYLKVPTAGTYVFYITFDNSVKFWIDETLIVSEDDAGVVELPPRALDRQRLYHIQVMFREVTGDARLVLEWKCDSCGITRQVIPSSAFYHSRLLLGNDFPRSFLVWDKPGEPEAFYRDNPSWNTVELRWIPPVNDGGKAITSYRIYRDNGLADAISNLVYESTNTAVYYFQETNLE
jgi:hypothetical protein